MEKRKLTWLLAMLILAGCSNTLQIAYQCTPSGALLYETETGRTMGVCPTTLNYELTPQQFNVGTLNVRGLTAKWASGATATTPSPMAVSFRDSLSRVFTFARPADARNLETDLRVSAEFDRNQALFAQAEAQRQAALLQVWQTMNANAVKPSVNCTSTPVGKTVYTNCR